MASTTTSADSSLWTVNSGSEQEYWNAYEAMRPKYADSSFLEHIYDYHVSKSHGPCFFDVAHEVACGSGKATVEIAKRFKQVIASDSNASSLDALRKQFQLTGNHIQYTQCTAEQLHLHHPVESADFISAAQCFPLFDSTAAISGFARVLKPNGTLAIWFYGRLHFSEQEYKLTCQPLFDRILNLIFAKVIKGGDPKSNRT